MPTSIAVELVKKLCDTCKVVSDAPTIQCDCCRYWFHSQCERRDLGVSSQAEDWYCSKCSQISKDLDEVLGNQSIQIDPVKSVLTDLSSSADESAEEEMNLDWEHYGTAPTSSSSAESAEEEMNSDWEHCETTPTSSSSGESAEEDVNSDSGCCVTCSRTFNDEEPIIRCNGCWCWYHYDCQDVPYNEEVETWHCSTCGVEPVDSEKEGKGSEWLDNALTGTSQLFDYLIREVGPIREPALKAKLEQCKLKIEIVLNKADTDEANGEDHSDSDEMDEAAEPSESRTSTEDSVDMSVAADETKEDFELEANSPDEEETDLGRIYDLVFGDDYKQMMNRS